MNIRKKVLLPVVATLLMGSVFGQNINIDVNLDVQHTLDTITHFDRNKFVTIHADVDEHGWGTTYGPNFTANLRDDFLNGYDVYLGRNTGGIQWNLNNDINEDSERDGFADPADITSTGTSAKDSYAGQTTYHAYEYRNDQIICTQLHPFYADGDNTNRGWAFSEANTLEEPFGTASGEYYGRYIRDHYGTGGATGKPKPVYAEIINEPLWHLVDQTHASEPEEVFRFHNAVADQIRVYNDDVEIGGFCTAFPDFEINDFAQWDERWKLFMDMCGDRMDFWTIHLYDFASISGGQERYRKGSNMEATFDMMEQYSYLEFDVVKPFMISEYGAQMHDYKGAWSPYRDWLHMKSVNSMMMQFMERADNINKTINFLPLKATWGTNNVNDTYSHRLMRRTDEPTALTGTWIYSDMVKTYQLWSDVKGIRVDSKSENPDIMTDAYINGNKVYVILNNLDFVSHELDLNIAGTVVGLSSVKIKHLYLDGTTDSDSPALDETIQATAPASVTIAPEGTYVIEYTYDSDITIDELSTEIKYYADEMLQAITANTPITFHIDGVTNGTYGEAVLRIGTGRSHGRSLQPEVTVNGIDVDVPTNFRGGPQTDRSTFFGVLEIPVHYSLLQTNNTITVQFPDSDGHVSSMAMQTYQFSNYIRRSWDVAVTGVNVLPETIITGVDQNRQLAAEILPEDASYKAVRWISDDIDFVTVDSVTGEITGMLEGTANVIATTVDGSFKDTCIVTVQTEEVAVNVDSVVLTPESTTILYGQTYQLLAQIYPTDATDDTLYWESDETGIASVDDNGLVTSESIGDAVITVRTNDGDFTATCSVAVIDPVPPSIAYDNVDNYVGPTFTIGEPIVVNTNYHAGTGNTVIGDGIKYFLREIEVAVVGGGWTVVNDVIVYDASVIGTESGTSSASLSTTGLTPTSELSGTNFYYLFVVLPSSAGEPYENSGIFPVTLENATVTIPVTAVSVVPASLPLSTGKTFTLAANVSPGNVTNGDVTWSSDATSVATVNASTGEVAALSVGTANIIATTVDGSFKDTCVVTVEYETAINGVSARAKNDLWIYPNPAREQITIGGLVSNKYSAKIFNIMGSEILSTELHNDDAATISTVGLPEGMYLLSISDGETIQTIRFNIKQ